MGVTRFKAIKDVQTGTRTGFGWSAGMDYEIHAPAGSIIEVRFDYWRIAGEKVSTLNITWPGSGKFGANMCPFELIGRLLTSGVIVQVGEEVPNEAIDE